MPIPRAELIKVIVGCACAALGVAHAVPVNSGSRQGWLEHSDRALGIRFQYPSTYRVWSRGNDIFIDEQVRTSRKSTYHQAKEVDLAFNGRILSNSDLYLVRLSIGRGDFHLANQKYKVFESRDAGMHVLLGRFENPQAKKINSVRWKGYEALIICSTEDEYGFHAAGGLCYWSLVSDDTRFALIDSQPLIKNQERLVRSMIQSIVFSN